MRESESRCTLNGVEPRPSFIPTGPPGALQAFRAPSKHWFGWYWVRELPDGRWSAEHTLRGPLGIHESKEAAFEACDASDRRTRR
jgi:hypothetical protein